MMQNKRAFGPRGSPPLLLKEERTKNVLLSSFRRRGRKLVAAAPALAMLGPFC